VLGGDLPRCFEGGYYPGVDFIEGFMILRGADNYAGYLLSSGEDCFQVFIVWGAEYSEGFILWRRGGRFVL